ncbi:MAG: hypothetical protein GY778_06185, partial [bacterium]|nr:hypothetical protein [bacterium]
MSVGRWGDGTLTVQGGGLLSIVEPIGGFPGFAVGSEDTGIGVMTVTGSGSEVLIDGAQPDLGGGSGFIAVGRFGDGTLNVTDGAQVMNDADGTTFVGRESTGFGTLVVDGQGNGATLFDAGAQVVIGADFDFDTGEVLFDSGGTGSVVVRDGGTARAGVAQQDGIDDIFIGAGGTVEIEAGGTVEGDVLLDGGSIEVGGVGDTATVQLTGDVTAVDATVRWDIQGSGAGQADQLNVTGTVDLSGGIAGFDFAGFSPAQNDSFTVFSAASGLTTDGQVSTVLLNVDQGLDFDLD